MTIGIKELIAKANLEIKTINVQEASTHLDDSETIFVDVRDIREIQREGKIPNAFHTPRGMLEFWIDPDSPYHNPKFALDKQFIFYCSRGWRSALATQIAQKMGMKNVCHIKDGYTAWVDADQPTEEVKKK